MKSNAHPLGEISDFGIGIEFQNRGSPHAHCVIWIFDSGEKIHFVGLLFISPLEDVGLALIHPKRTMHTRETEGYVHVKM